MNTWRSAWPKAHDKGGEMALFQKEGVLKDGSRVILRPMVKEDREKLLDFFHRVDDRDLMFLRDDVRDPATIDEWIDHLDYHLVFPLLAEQDGRIVGNATLHMRKVGWKRHLGNVRIVIAKDSQGKGLGTLMINEIVGLAVEFGLEKLIAEIHLQATAALATFKSAGFSPKAIFEDLVEDPSGKKGDLVVMVCDVLREEP
jgi:RimJ/RimL family protein N-acetyltransferase